MNAVKPEFSVELNFRNKLEAISECSQNEEGRNISFSIGGSLDDSKMFVLSKENGYLVSISAPTPLSSVGQSPTKCY